MMKRMVIIILCVSLLYGCWDEQQYRDVTIVPLFGLEGENGQISSRFIFPIFEEHEIKYSHAEGRGTSLRDARLDANHRAVDGLEFSHLEVVLISSETAKHNINDLLDSFYRTPRNRLSSYLAVVEGELEPYFKPPTKLDSQLPNYYSGILRTASIYAFAPDNKLQQARTLLFEDAIDLSLPYIVINKETGIPTVAGSALFSGQKYTGKTLNSREAIIENMLRKQHKKLMRLTLMWRFEETEYPVTIDVFRINRKLHITSDRIEATYKIKVEIDEFAHDHFSKAEMIHKMESFLSEQLTNEFTKVIAKLQEAKSDTIGFGLHVRPFHQSLWNKGKWQDTFSEIEIIPKVHVTVSRTGLLE